MPAITLSVGTVNEMSGASLNGYTINVDQTSESEWNSLLSLFADASIYQTWAYGAARWGRGRLSHVVLQRNQRPVALAQTRLVPLPGLPGGLAYVGWGPAWQLKGESPDLGTLRQVLVALRIEYAEMRGLGLKVVPNILSSGEHTARRVFAEEGFKWKPRPGRTILVDLSPSLEELRAGFRRRWRQTLEKAERTNIETIIGTGVEHFDMALTVYREMHDRKQFAEFVDKRQFRQMQAGLPEEAKMRILLCKADAGTIAALAWAVIGDTGLPLLAATGRRALENDAAYLMWWKMLAWLKLNGFRYCDLGGINQERNYGGFIFKSGMAKKHGQELDLLGEFEVAGNWASRTSLWMAGCVKRTLAAQKLWLERLRSRKAPVASMSRKTFKGGSTNDDQS